MASEPSRKNRAMYKKMIEIAPRTPLVTNALVIIVSLKKNGFSPI
jgi:hypothetical protein